MPKDTAPNGQDLNAIASTMLQQATPPRKEAKAVAETDDVLEDQTDEVVDEGAEEAEAEAAQAAEDEATEDATEDEDADDTEEHPDFPELTEIGDDTVFSVTVDGEETEVTLADLKKAYSGEGAIAKRLQDATEAKKAVEAERQQIRQELDTGRQKLVQAFKTFDAMMFQPSIAKPDPSLQKTDPQQYLIQMENYREDQSRLQARRSQVQGAMQQYEAQQRQEFEAQKAENSRLLVEALPDLVDPVKGPVLAQSITETAQSYGFSSHEISSAVDYRLFRMAADAAAYRALQSRQQVKPVNETPKTKVLRPGVVKQKQQTAKARQTQATYRKAAQTGSIEDVAATMLQPIKR